MKKSFNIILIFVICFTSCRSQSVIVSETSECGKLDMHMHDYYRDTLLSDYIARKNPSLESYFATREQSILLKTSFCSDSLIVFNDMFDKKKIDIQISKTQKNLENHDLKIVDLLEYSFIEYVDENRAFGLLSDEKNVTVIDELKIKINDNELLVPKEAYQTLFFPNFCMTFKSIRPLQVYKSHDEKKIFIYIFGSNGLNENTTELREVTSFMAKLVFEVDKGYVGRIVLKNTELNAYQWDCPNFKGI